MLTATLLLVVLTTAPLSEPRLAVAPCPSLIDVTLSVQVSGLAPRQQVTIAATATDATQRVWRSQAAVTADAEGRIDLARQKPDSGSYAAAKIPAALRNERPSPERWSITEVLEHLVRIETGITKLFMMKGQTPPPDDVPAPAPEASSTPAQLQAARATLLSAFGTA